MKKVILALAAVLVFALLLASFSEVSADPNEPIECLVDMDFNGAYWEGTVNGCALAGSVRFDPDPDNESYEAGNSLHFFELFTINVAGGDEIRGTTAGVGHLNQPPFQFIANGWVTDATGPWTHLIGNKYFESGLVNLTTDPALPFQVKDMVMRIVPAQHP